MTGRLPAFLLFSVFLSCSIFHPGRMADGALFITEKEMAGDFTGRRLIFNARDVLVGVADVHRSCTVEPSGDRLRCVENIHYDVVHEEGHADARGRDEERRFSIAFRYISERAVELSYSEEGAPPFNLAFFQGGEVSGAGIRVFGGTIIPLSNVPSGLELRLVREDYVPVGTTPALPQHYHEKRTYSYFGFQYGYAETRWERGG